MLRISALSTRDIVKMKVRQFLKNHDEPARAKFELVLLMNVRFVCFALHTTHILAIGSRGKGTVQIQTYYLYACANFCFV